MNQNRAGRIWQAMDQSLELEGYDDGLQRAQIIVTCGQLLIMIAEKFNTRDPLLIEALKRTASVLQIVKDEEK